MSYDFCITESEKTYLRELARKQLEYANLPVMEERRKLWYSHNSLKGERPVIVMEMDTFANDILPAPICVSPAAVEIENNLNRFIVNHELIDDDKVIPDYYTIYWKIDIKEFGLKFEIAHAKDSNGRELGYKIQ